MMEANANGPLRWGILSTARINDEILPAMREAADAQVVAVASRDADRGRRYADQHGIARSYGSYEDLLADRDIDCVYIPLPNTLHYEWARAALGAGKHVLCEKPLTPTRREADELFDYAASEGVVLMEAFMYRHHPKIKQLREIVAGGLLGEVQVIRSWFHFKTEDPVTDIRYDPQLAGGALRDVGCYCISISNYLAGGAPNRVKGAARVSNSGVDESFAGALTYDDNIVASFDCGIFTDLDIGLKVLGSEGHASVETPWYPHLEPLAIEVRSSDGITEIETPASNAYRLEIDNFCQAVRGNAAVEITREETLRTLETIELLNEDAAAISLS
jgi:D-xylose 1-dehydrogenase (NADP+, D-xylono-1,5-lactone-forming)